LIRQPGRFFAALLAEFSPDPMRVLAASKAYAAEPSAANLAQLSIAAEPPRQELLRRLNRAPGGTAAILRMRERLLELKSDRRELDAVDWDLRHLLSSWFNPGFLEIVRVDWRTPAYLLEQIIAHEAVHEIRGWNDLRRRLDVDRRCFAFFHPALPEEPLIFVEVALMDRMAEVVPPLLDAQSASSDPSRATTAVFYSISNCQPGLRGVSLGNFLIKNVVDVLSGEFPPLFVDSVRRGGPVDFARLAPLSRERLIHAHTDVDSSRSSRPLLERCFRAGYRSNRFRRVRTPIRKKLIAPTALLRPLWPTFVRC
jgi:malonyl-CoA decarboxylase